jgi:acyl-coenzyme A thioesterase PaaI-like protein
MPINRAYRTPEVREGSFLTTPRPQPDAATALSKTTRRVLASLVRSLASLTMLTTVEDRQLVRATELVRLAIEELTPSARSGRYEGVPGLSPGSDTNDLIWETHAAFGASNPLAPPVEAEEHHGRVTGNVTFDRAWEGGPGLVYGGFIAAVFDGMCGRAVMSAGHVGVTRSLTVRFLRPTPLRRPLKVETVAGEPVGRNVSVTGQLWDGDTLTCEAEAVFTCVGADQYRA